MASVQISDVRKSFGGFEVLHGVTVPIEDGAFVGSRCIVVEGVVVEEEAVLDSQTMITIMERMVLRRRLRRQQERLTKDKSCARLTKIQQ